MKLVIVESPSKARTLGRFLGRGFRVQASMGHVRDLPVSEFGVDVEHDFRPRYVVVRGKMRTIKELQSAAKEASQVLLATDPDREGEAISWHLAQLLGLPETTLCRIEFHEITPRAVQQALAHPRAIDARLVDAQQARRVLDRVVGYRLSPFLWKKVQRGLSAGRVQSVALRLLVEREQEIEAFRPQEYWTIDVPLRPAAGTDDGAAGTPPGVFKARLAAVDGQAPEIANQEQAAALVAELLETATFRVNAITRQDRLRHPLAPFTTSTLQQEASRRFGMTARRTMSIAQQLYEGLDAGAEGPVGLITYMRTDSVHLAPEAVAQARAYIQHHFGAAAVPAQSPRYRSRKGAQEAHEAIRPTSVDRTPDQLKAHLNRDQWRLYDLIWRRFVASQMTPATVRTISVRIGAGRMELRAAGSTVVEEGFLRVWGLPPADDGEGEEGAAMQEVLARLVEGQSLERAGEPEPRQHFTQPPPRFNDASLVKTMEELGIGRPSTYAPTIETLLDRRYVLRDGRQLVPTPLGRAVVELLRREFPDIVDVEFTARMEAQLDAVESGQLAWDRVVAEFYHPFAARLAEATRAAERVTVAVEATNERCEKCGRPMVIKWGRFGRFLACSGFPECRNTRPLVEHLGVACPRCGAELVTRHTRRGRTFYGCSRYPQCTYTIWYRPVGRNCPQCGRPLVVRRGRGGQGGATEQVVCSGLYDKDPKTRQPVCRYVEPSSPDAAARAADTPATDAAAAAAARKAT